ncbi:Acetyltransferase (isoleucine patch superfamily) [Desulfonatronum thiosulfatophilum]|uniref:Acetyltransferase (Isoleucine patch superfamily) n=1 Tax=Desulfonatronum thiosulfatophilum TaxID=617002 RepID=A0A1G6C0K4_9BACT|nr:hypothetical protein [Desulfonatronum thiosulfatophilum]SDB26358.1 Acetyltransferase (isoleucine patch superfamily) [Desulfonatronum thiosulfatophilum]
MIASIKKGLFMIIEVMLRIVIHPYIRARIFAVLGSKIGKNVRIYEVRLINVENGFSNLTIDDDAHIGTGCIFDLKGMIFVGKGATLSPFVTILTHNDPGSHHNSPICNVYPPNVKSVFIDEYCWIGCNSTILPGTHVKRSTVVGACSLVKGILEKECLYVGTPVKKVKGITVSD